MIHKTYTSQLERFGNLAEQKIKISIGAKIYATSLKTSLFKLIITYKFEDKKIKFSILRSVNFDVIRILVALRYKEMKIVFRYCTGIFIWYILPNITIVRFKMYEYIYFIYI